MNLEQLSAWEAETLDLLASAQATRARLEQKMEGLRQDLAEAQAMESSIAATLEAWRAKNGRPKTSPRAADSVLAAEYDGLTNKQIVNRWAETHDGLVVMNDMTSALAAAGVFAEKRQADGALYPVVRRSPTYVKEDRGVYRKRPSVRAFDSGMQPPANFSSQTTLDARQAVASVTALPATFHAERQTEDEAIVQAIDDLMDWDDAPSPPRQITSARY